MTDTHEVPETAADKELEATLPALEAVQDCCVIERRGRNGGERVAYVVRTGAAGPDEIARQFRNRFPAVSPPDLFIPVAFIPLTPEGEPDREALLALEAPDAQLLEIGEQELRRAGAERAALLLDESAEEPPPLHLADLLPNWKRSQAADAEAPATSRSAPVSEAGPKTQRPPSISSGEPLRLPVPDTLPDALRRAAAEFGSQGIVYVQEDGAEIIQTYAELLEDAQSILTALRQLGAKPGDRFLFQFPHNQDFVPAFWGCTLGGFIPVPISVAPTYEQPNATVTKLNNAWLTLDRPWFLTSRDLVPALRGLASRFGFDSELRIAAIEDLRPAEPARDWHESRPEDLALLLFTSGSTGKPKAVRQFHRSLLRRSAATAQMNGFHSGNVSLNWMPLDHVGGIVMYHLLDVYLGARQVHAPTPAIAQSPLKWLDLIEKHRATSTWAPNFAYGLVNAQAEEIAKRRWDLSSLGFILNAGEAIVSRTARRFLEVLEPHGLPKTAMRPAWGMSETCSAVTFSSKFTLATTSDRDPFVEVGAAVPEFSMRIVDNEGLPVEEGAIGRLQVKGPSVTTGYDNNPTANEESFTQDGWFQTGDLGILNDGCLMITGRQKDVIIVNGVNFYSHELEAIVEETPGVEISFTAVCAVREEGADTDSIAVFFSPSEAGRKRLAGVIQDARANLVRNAGIDPTWFVPLEKGDIPKTEIGKIQRAQLRKRLEAGELEEVLKRVDVLTESAHTVPDWFFEKIWQRKSLRPGAGAQGTVAVIAGPDGLGREVCELLRAGGLRAVEVEALGEAHQPLRTLVYLADWDWPVSGIVEQIRSIQNVVKQALEATRGSAEPVVFYAVSNGSQPGLPAVLRSLAAEEPGLECRHIEVSPSGGGAAAQAIAAEVSAGVAEPEVAWRDGARYVPRLRRARFDRELAARNSFVRGGVYLLTGGMGGIGTQIARFLMTQFGAHVLLVGRKPASNDALAALSALGPVRYGVADVCDAAALGGEIEAAEKAWGRPLDGVLHLAAAYHDGPLANETEDTLRNALQAKAEGARVLDRLLEARPEAAFIGFSSVLSFFPGAMVGAYAAANRILEDVVSARVARGLRAWAFEWSVWRDIGMSRGQSSFEALRARGIRAMSAEQAWKSMLAGMGLRGPIVAVGLDPANPEIRRVTAGADCGIWRLRAFYTLARGSEAGKIGALQLRDRFGREIVPHFHETGEIPVDAAGNPDRAALLDWLRKETRGGSDYVEPETDTEREICGIWESVLGAPRVGALDNFFALGGQSLLATRVMSRLRSAFGVDLPLRGLFDNPTVRSLAAAVSKLMAKGGEGEASIRRVEDRSRLPLSFTQQRLWYLDQFLPGSPVYNIPLVFRLDAVPDSGILARSLREIVRRHESLRTVFQIEDGEPVQKVLEVAETPVEAVDLRPFGDAAYEEALRLSAEEVRRPFDLSRDVLVRARVFRLAEAASVVAMTMHHIAADGWSIDLLMRELNSNYEEFRLGRPPEAGPLPVQFADYAVWQRGYLQGDILREHDEYWQSRLGGAPPQLKLPADLPRPARQTFRGAIHTLTLAPELREGVAAICRAYDVTPFIALLTVFQVLLRQYSGQNDISVGSPIANRTHVETEGLIGFFANTLVLRTVFPGDASYKDLLGVVRETALGAYAHQHMPFERLVAILKQPRNPGYNPLFQANFRVVTSAPVPLQIEAVTGVRVPVDPGTARFDFALDLLFTPDRFEGYFEYSTDLFLPATILRVHADFENLLRELCRDPETPLGSLGLDKIVTAFAGKPQGVIRRRAARPLNPA